jgi:hypothetical protein
MDGLKSLRAANRFLRSYEKNTVLQAAIEGATRDLVRMARSQPKNWLSKYDKVSGLRHRVLKIDVSGKDRLLAFYDAGCLTLLDVGDRKIVGEYRDAMLPRDLAGSNEAPCHFWPEHEEGFFTSIPYRDLEIWASEISPDWLYYLDDEQDKVVRTVVEQSEDVLLRTGYYRAFFLLGGPGTGKTSILLNLLKRFYNQEKFDVRITLSDPVADYIERSTGIGLSKFRCSTVDLGLNAGSGDFRTDIILVDDPLTRLEIERALETGKFGAAKVVVVAFDPLQLEHTLFDATFDELVRDYGVQAFWLNTCYRQKENVGTATKRAVDAIAASTAYLDRKKIEDDREARSELTKASNSLVFRNPTGYAERYPSATLADWQDEIARIREQAAMRWKHWPGVLVVVDDENGVELPQSWRRELRRVPHHEVATSQIGVLKGLEYQHVLLILSRRLYEEANAPHQGYGQRTYDQRRLLRIPFSRAKDSLVVFAV